MSQIYSTVAKTLSSNRNRLSTITPQSPDEIIQIGAALEALTRDLPFELEAMTDLVYVCLEGLQFVFQNSEHESFSMILHAVSAAMVAAEQSAVAPTNPICLEMMDNAKRSLRVALNLEQNADAETEVSENLTIEKLSLDDIAALIVALDPSDTENLTKAANGLREISENYPPDRITRKQLLKVSRELQKVINGNAADAQKIVNRAGEVISLILAETEQEVVGEPTPERVEINPANFVLEENEIAVKAITETSLEFSLPANADLNLLTEFIAESGEYIEAAEAALLTLECEPDNEAVNTVFRAFHTIKGTSAFLGMKHLAELTHNAETLFSRIRDREIKCSGDYADLALRSVDAVKAILEEVQNGLDGDAMHLPENYHSLLQTLANPQAAVLCADKPVIKVEITPKIEDVSSANAEEESQPPARLGDILVAQNKVTREQLEAAFANANGTPIGTVLMEAGLVSSNDVQNALREQKRVRNNADTSIRVQTEKLDNLIDMIGELVVAQSILVQDTAILEGNNFGLSRKVSHVGKIVRELQDLSMTMRMIPLKSSFQKVARAVRDVAQKCGKMVDFTTEGEDTEIDRNMVDIIADPLIHMIRNSVDHGIETPVERAKTGKNQIGKVRLSAYHSGGSVIVELADDGRGLDRERITKKAIVKGLIESEKGMSDGEIYNLIFEPGFSTVEEVTDVSGRGVGMDVVRRNIEAMHGRIEIASEKGKGCTFTLRLPLTLAITDGMLIRVGAERFIVPTLHIHLSFRPNKETFSTVIGRGEMVQLRGELMPIYRLHQLFDIKNAEQNLEQGLLMVVTDGNKRCALLVDELLGQQQVVAKPIVLGRDVGKIQGISGGAILGDGSVGLILDTSEIVGLARQSSAVIERTVKEDFRLAA